MRTFTKFKAGDTITVQPFAKRLWPSTERKGDTFTVTAVRTDADSHAYDEGCRDQNCIHAWSHPDQLETAQGLFSAFYFDPECAKYQR